jgi:cysteine synthase A
MFRSLVFSSRKNVRHLNIVSKPSELVGNTPLIYLDNLAKGLPGRLVGKLESLGPCSSVKDRLGRSMIEVAEADGTLTRGKSVIIEPTSGNTGIALAFLARERGYRCILTMPETMSVERRLMLMALGAEVVLTPKETAVAGAIAKANEIKESIGEDAVILQQFENKANPKVHRETTGPEIWRDTDGKVDVFISGVGTGGTVTGVTQYIKGCSELGLAPLNPNLYTVAVEPQEQMLLTAARGGEKIGDQGPHKIQGMGAGIIPAVLNLNVIDEVVPVHSDEAMAMCSRIWLEEGLPVGVSSGAIVAAALKVLARPEMEGKVGVCIIPSFGERYFTHPMYDTLRANAHALEKQPLPAPFDNREYGFATERG